jgi:hypothetical protein
VKASVCEGLQLVSLRGAYAAAYSNHVLVRFMIVRFATWEPLTLIFPDASIRTLCIIIDVLCLSCNVAEAEVKPYNGKIADVCVLTCGTLFNIRS